MYTTNTYYIYIYIYTLIYTTNYTTTKYTLQFYNDSTIDDNNINNNTPRSIGELCIVADSTIIVNSTIVYDIICYNYSII